jgi:uncharacterized protein YjbJ (UPF0337 family)
MAKSRPEKTIGMESELVAPQNIPTSGEREQAFGFVAGASRSRSSATESRRYKLSASETGTQIAPFRCRYSFSISNFQRSLVMANEDKMAGKVKQAKGKAKEVTGAARGDTSQELKGKAQKNLGKAQEKMGKMSERKGRR